MSAREPIDYEAFLRAKVAQATSHGFDVEPAELNTALKDNTRAMVRWMLAGGRRALFASFGLHKTCAQIECMRLIGARHRGVRLIVLPLGVRGEFMSDAARYFSGEFAVRLKFIRRVDEIGDDATIYLTNYESVRERILDLDAIENLVAVSLDEAAILRGFGGTKTFRESMAVFAGDDRRDKSQRIKTDGVPFRFVATATPDPNETIELLAYAAFLGVMDVGQAKAQPLDAKVLTPTGWRLMGHLQAGDAVIAGDGTPTRVLRTYPQGDRPVFRLDFSDGTSTEADADHLWLTQTQYERNNERRWRERNAGEPGDRYASVRTTADIASTLLTAQGGKNHKVPLVSPVQFPARPVDIDPWLLGFLLGDGCIRETSVVISTVDAWIVEEVARHLGAFGLRLRRTADGGCDYSITSTGTRGGGGPGSNALLTALRGYELLGKRAWEKTLPQSYVVNDVATRLAILQGLMDSDGTVHEDGTMIRFSSSSKALSEQVRDLARSLGGTASLRTAATAGRDAHLVTFSLPRGLSPFRLPRKAERITVREKYPPTRYIVAVQPVGTKPSQCIAIEHPSRLYVTDDFVVTHNTRFFKRNSEKADQLTLHLHKEVEFWMWVASWALFVQRPSDLGFSDEGYSLPALDVQWHELPSDHGTAGAEKDGQGKMFRSSAIGVQDAAREKRDSLGARVAKVQDLARGRGDDQLIVWCDLNDEQRAVERALQEEGATYSSLYGSQPVDDREAMLQAWRDRKTDAFVSKPVMYGAGVNLQQCHTMIFAGISFKFADTIQAIHRIQRFGQQHACTVHMIYTEAEREIRRDLERKWKQHDATVGRMTAIIREYGLARISMVAVLQRSIGCERREASGRTWQAVNNDCVAETTAMESDSVGLIVTSIPFSHQYEYSPSYNDFGHTDDNEHFWRQMDFLTPQLLRVLQPGRVCAVHVKDRITPGGINGFGFQTVTAISDQCREHFERHGFAFLARVTIATDVVRENNQTYRLGWTEQCKDGSRMGHGLPEYLMVFRKPPTDRSNGYADVPVVKDKGLYTRPRWQYDAHGFWRSSGNRMLQPGDLDGRTQEAIYKAFKKYSLENVYDFERDVALAEHVDRSGWLPSTFMLMPPASWHPEIWTDVARMRTLNADQAARGQEMHLCPLQFDIVDRVIVQHSMPGEVVFDPFAGIGTVPVRAVKHGRRGLGCELNAGYFNDSLWYLKAEEMQHATPSLFDLDALDADQPSHQEAA